MGKTDKSVKEKKPRLMPKIKDMPFQIGFQMRIFPDYKQKDIIAFNDGVARFVYNRLKQNADELFRLKKVKIYCEPVVRRINYLTSIGKEVKNLQNAYPFLNDKRADSQCIANAIKNYDAAWDNFRKVKGTSIPAYHKKSYKKAYNTNAHYKTEDTKIGDGNVHLTDRHHIQIPKLGKVKFKCSDWIYEIFSRKCMTCIGKIKVWMNHVGEYYITLQIGSVEPFHESLQDTEQTVGIDMNIKNFYTDSNGKEVENPHIRKKEQKKIAKLQKRLARRLVRAKKEGRNIYTSSNYQKTRVQLAKVFLKTERRRSEFHDIESKRIVEQNQTVCFEDLKSANLLKNHCLASAISDCGWSKFIGKVEYKCKFYNRTFVKVPARNTTQTCSKCGFVRKGEEKITLDIREWECPKCNTFHFRDKNAAINILNKGLLKLENNA